MREEQLALDPSHGSALALPVTWVHTLVIGSGAAGLNAALQAHAQGLSDLLVLTEGLGMGTSINTGSDKQTYYKLSLCGAEGDSPRALAETLFEGGSMHGDLALVEASLSARAFLNLVNLGVPFPQDRYGQFPGYKTDHDPRQRATSIGPYTSREMCRVLIRELHRREIPVREGRSVVALLTVGKGEGKRAAGGLALNEEGRLEAYAAENVVWATGGPGGLYRSSAYPAVHTGGIGLALLAGARAQNLAESQFGLASLAFRWNVSGSYMQAIPRFISTAPDGVSEAHEFLHPYLATPGEVNALVFLKGYQWPFDARKVAGGSSLVDILVYIETVERGRRVFLDYRRNPEGFAWEELAAEARDYLTKSKALQDTPVERLRAMNPGAVALYAEHGIDLAAQPLEVAVCAQHNNGGLASNVWCESSNIKHLFPVGEVNGSHGVYRPGGAALNAGQVGGYRVAEFIARRYAGWTLAEEAFCAAAKAGAHDILEWLARAAGAASSWQEERAALGTRMTRAGAHIRAGRVLHQAVAEAQTQWRRISRTGCRYQEPSDASAALTTRQLCFAHLVYLEAIRYAVQSGVGSRGSAIVRDGTGDPIHGALGDAWRMVSEDASFRAQVLETEATPEGQTISHWVPRRPLPETDLWFETAWAAFRAGSIYRDEL